MIIYPNYPGLRTETLLDLHNPIKKAIAADDLAPKGQDKPYGVPTLCCCGLGVKIEGVCAWHITVKN